MRCNKNSISEIEGQIIEQSADYKIKYGMMESKQMYYGMPTASRNSTP